MTTHCAHDKTYGQCCCQCVSHMPVHHHCSTASHDLRKKHSGCCCGIRKGWACVAPELGRVYDNWPEHSQGCELFARKAESANPITP